MPPPPQKKGRATFAALRPSNPSCPMTAAFCSPRSSSSSFLLLRLAGAVAAGAIAVRPVSPSTWRDQGRNSGRHHLPSSGDLPLL
mmetsp:Transcript_3506/g.9012  ORF Transcript_3506/g.9012 Transcript_3506/m.9012 type:complete len:85 (+) Transcript_3506:1-255(+)